MNPVDAFVPEHISRLMSGDELCNFLEDVKHRSCLRNLSFILGMLDHDTLPLGGRGEKRVSGNMMENLTCDRMKQKKNLTVGGKGHVRS